MSAIRAQALATGTNSPPAFLPASTLALTSTAPTASTSASTEGLFSFNIHDY